MRSPVTRFRYKKAGLMSNGTDVAGFETEAASGSFALNSTEKLPLQTSEAGPIVQKDQPGGASVVTKLCS